MKVEKATIADAAAIQQMVNGFADQGEMLPRALSDIYEHIRDYFVLRNAKQMVGCVALHITWSDLAEIRSLAVEAKNQKRRVGSLLVQACLDEASELGIPTVFCLTRKPDFFQKNDFHLVDKMELPQKIWAECYRCPKFPNCDEVALVRHI
ncbi:MAG: N-acetyltransferase [Chloroflexota bacterium]|nr:N-acetyltransferase [Chloroflexota bacterium]